MTNKIICIDKLNLYAVNYSFYNIKFVKNKTLEICLAAVKQCGTMLKYIDNQTPEICIEAIKNDPYSIAYVKNKTPEMYALIKEKYIFDYIRINHVTNSYEVIQDQDEDCMICMDNKGSWCQLQCGHKYHINCITECMKTSSRCPYCFCFI
jgi:hypothetical protein